MEVENPREPDKLGHKIIFSQSQSSPFGHDSIPVEEACKRSNHLNICSRLDDLGSSLLRIECFITCWLVFGISFDNIFYPLILINEHHIQHPGTKNSVSNHLVGLGLNL